MDRSLERLFLLVSLAAALTVAVLYVLGTVAISAQLHHAGVHPLDGVGLFSVGQLLVRGVAVAATPTAILGIAVVTVIFWYFFHPRRSGGVDDSPLSRSARRRVDALEADAVDRKAKARRRGPRGCIQRITLDQCVAGSAPSSGCVAAAQGARQSVEDSAKPEKEVGKWGAHRNRPRNLVPAIKGSNRRYTY